MQLNLILLAAICVVTAHGASNAQRKTELSQPGHRIRRSWNFFDSNEDDFDSITESRVTLSTTQSTTKTSTTKKPKKTKRPKKTKFIEYDDYGFAIDPEEIAPVRQPFIDAITSTGSTSTTITPPAPSSSTITTSKSPTNAPMMTSTTISTSKSTPSAPTTPSTSSTPRSTFQAPILPAIQSPKAKRTLATAYIERQNRYLDQFESQVSRSQFEMAYASLVELQRRIDPMLETLTSLLGRECLVLWPYMSSGTSTPGYCKTSKDEAEAQLVAFENLLLRSRSYREGAENVKDLTAKMHEKYARAMKDSLKNLAHNGRPGQLVDLPASMRAFAPATGANEPTLVPASAPTPLLDYEDHSYDVVGSATVD